jgi:Tfp pilus assembly protein PilZ
MNVSHRVRQQLILSKQLLTSAEASASISSDVAMLARDLIVCYGAAELAVAAICARLDCLPDKREICLPDYFAALRRRRDSQCEAQDVEFVAELHGVRANSQLRSMQPDPRRWKRVRQETVEHVARWCQQFLGLNLLGLDSAQTVTAPRPMESSEEYASNEKLSVLAHRDPERRRYACFGSADIRLGLVGGLERGRIANLSAGGCYVTTDAPYKVGEQVEMTLHVNKMSFRVAGSVVNVPPLVAAGHRKAGLAGMDIQFQQMSAGSRARLQELIGELQTKGQSRVAKRPGG